MRSKDFAHHHLLGSDTPVAGVPAETVTVTGQSMAKRHVMDLSGLSNAEYRVLVTGEHGGCYREWLRRPAMLTQSLAE
ncbi:hypothetical protein O9993_15180 [Vibrio lentus]|nr:hypothetical protein [Vibrio lentus]